MQQIRKRTKLLALWTGLILLLSISGCGNTDYISGDVGAPPPVTQKTQAALKAAVDDYMQYVGTPSGVPGTIVAVKMNGYQPWYYAYGSAEIALPNNPGSAFTQKTAMDAGMPFRIASITKMFIAQAVIQLAQEGKIDLDQTVENYLPGALTGKNLANKDKITINMLLNHTSGLYSYVTSDAGLLHGNLPTAAGTTGLRLLPMDTFVEGLGLTAWSHSYSPQDTILQFANTFSPPLSLVDTITGAIGNPYGSNPYFAPGTDLHYSNTNYYLLGLLIQKIAKQYETDPAKQTVEYQIKRLITDPLKLSDTYLPTTKTFNNPVHVHGYADYFNSEAYRTAMSDNLLKFSACQNNSAWCTGDGILEDFTEIDPSFAWTTGGMISSAKDLLTFAQFVTQTRVQTGQEAGKWINGSPLDNSTTFQYGRGIARINNVMFGHGGQFAGYNVAVYWYAPLDIYFMVMTNKYSYTENDPNDLGGSIVAGADSMYALSVKQTTAAPVDHNRSIINSLITALEQDPNVAKKGATPVRLSSYFLEM